jgi:hypothetical protein
MSMWLVYRRFRVGMNSRARVIHQQAAKNWLFTDLSTAV